MSSRKSAPCHAQRRTVGRFSTFGSWYFIFVVALSGRSIGTWQDDLFPTRSGESPDNLFGCLEHTFSDTHAPFVLHGSKNWNLFRRRRGPLPLSPLEGAGLFDVGFGLCGDFPAQLSRVS